MKSRLIDSLSGIGAVKQFPTTLEISKTKTLKNTALAEIWLSANNADVALPYHPPPSPTPLPSFLLVISSRKTRGERLARDQK